MVGLDVVGCGVVGWLVLQATESLGLLHMWRWHRLCMGSRSRGRGCRWCSVWLCCPDLTGWRVVACHVVRCCVGGCTWR